MRFARSAFIASALLESVVAHHAAKPAFITQPRRQATSSGLAATFTSVSNCHQHGTTQYCEVGTTEYQMKLTPTSGQTLPTAYSDCHSHGSSTYCVDENGDDVQVLDGDASSSAVVTSTSAVAAAASITSVSECHSHGTAQYCVSGTAEYQMKVTPTSGQILPKSYNDCHTHGSSTYCVDAAGHDVQVLVEGSATGSAGAAATSTSASGENCHFHAGVEHCVGADEEEGDASCETTHRDYNVSLRMGLLFVILVTSGLGVFLPIMLGRFSFGWTDITLVIMKQFGTGIIISTAFVHLFTHASLMFNNECLGELDYEATTAAIVMAGIFISFFIEYVGHRIVNATQAKHTLSHQDSGDDAVQPKGNEGTAAQRRVAVLGHHGDAQDALSVYVMEAGIIFHSLLIGLTLVVSGDLFFITLFIVIIFHQFFEGLALGTCIAGLPSSGTSAVKLPHRLLMGAGFAVVTPIGMAIGIGVLNQFNGNDPSTIIPIGTLDAFSAGILVWVGVVEMLARDWLHGSLAKAGVATAAAAMVALIAGMVLMSLLGKWA